MFSTKNDRMEEAIEDSKDDSFKVGTVIANVDPLNIGRIQCSIPNLYDPTQGPVPWIGRSSLSPFGQGSGYGWYGSPAIGSLVRIMFQQGDPHYPIWVSDEYIAPNANSKFASPQTWGFRDPAGNELFVNMQTGDWQWTHQSSSTVFWDSAGDGTFGVKGNLAINVTGNSNIQTQGNTTIQTQGNTAINSTGTTDITGSTINLN